MAEVVTEALLSSAFKFLFGRLASPELLNLFKGRKRSEGLLKGLNLKLIILSKLLTDAENKHITDAAVKRWLGELQDAVYHADDLLDKIAYEALRRKVEAEYQSRTSQAAAGHSILTWIRRFCKRRLCGRLSALSFDVKTMSDLEGVIGRLEDFVKQNDVLGLRDISGLKSLDRYNTSSTTTSLVDKSKVFGREKDKEKILDLLISYDSSGGYNVPGVIPIVGMGGLGKTTLAQLVYNDGRVDEHFEMKAWVCVSHQFDVLKVTKSILEAITKIVCSLTDLDQVQVSLQEKLRGKKHLIVLDDVWNDNCIDWENLSRPFTAGAHGSKIIVTTRNRSVADIMRTVPVHKLQQLSDDDCWALFDKTVFNQGDSSADYPNLKQIGIEIVKKCKGLPLAAKILGGLLRSKRNVEEWNNILESDVWNLPEGKILPALRLSYDYLPSHLKQCFAFSSIYPQDFVFEKESLVLLWIAHNFVHPSGNKTLKRVGYEYFDQLVSRSFFQRANSLDESYFTMHDLIHDLADQVLSGEFSFRLEDRMKKLGDISEKVRHFSYVRGRDDSNERFEAINKVKCLRTFLPLQCGGFSIDCTMLDVLQALPCLRVLSLPNFGFTELPDWIGKMIHLRHLDLSFSPIAQLPDSVCSLYNLQTLLLSGCSSLTTLPIGIGKLVCLHHLHSMGTSLTEMPMQISRLTSLQELTNFVVGKRSDSGVGVNGLKELQQLQGTLSISNLQNVTSGRDASEARLEEKKLQELELEWGGGVIDDLRNDERDVLQNLQREILENLQPHANLKRLTIKNYGGTTFPSWLGDTSFSNIVSLLLLSCKYCSSLPPLGQLCSLKELTIGDMNEVREVAPQFYGDISSVKQFESLEILRFENMLEWERWSVLEARGKFSRLQELSIRNCPKLQDLPTDIPTLVKLQIQGCPELKPFPPLRFFPTLRLLSIHNFTKLVILSTPDEHGLRRNTTSLLEFVDIISCPNMISFSSQGGVTFPNLNYFRVMTCEKLKSLPEGMESLEKFVINECPEIESFPEGCLPSKLRELYIKSCNTLKSLPEGMQSLRELVITNCPEIEFFPKGGLPSNLRSLLIGSCKKLKGLPEGMRTLFLSIWDCPEIESFPQGGQPSNLRWLRIHRCKKLKALPEGMRTLLPSLESLEIYECPEIESFPESGLPSNLHKLSIHNCTKLVARRSEWGIHTLSSLEKFEIGEGLTETSSFPDEGLLPSTLTSLCLSYLPDLESLNNRGLQLLSSLKNLEIYGCPQLQSFQEDRLPTSLNRLRIEGSPLLTPRCQREKGKDWHKIAHIPDIMIDHQCI